MDPLRLTIAVTPLAAYFLLIGLVNLRGKPLLVSGSGDLAALGAALSGVAFVGPISLFRPEAATGELGDYVWLFLITFYWLWVALVVMLCRPRLVVYGVSADELRPVLSDVARGIDPAARWAGQSVSLPTAGVHAHVDEAGWGRLTSLVASGGRQDPEGWRRLTRLLDRAVRSTPGRPNRAGASQIALGAALLGVSLVALLADPPAVVLAWAELFSFGRA